MLFLKIIIFFFNVVDAACIIPINDIRGVESMGYSKGEKILRCKLAALFRLVDLFGWSKGINNDITVRKLLTLFKKK